MGSFSAVRSENDKGATYSFGEYQVSRKEVTPYTMRGPSSDVAPAVPSPLLALVAASVVSSFSASWLARPVASLASDLQLRADRVSRLKGKLLRPFESLLDRALARGRQPLRSDRAWESKAGANAGAGALELKVRGLEALLEVARDVMKSVSIRKRVLQDRLVAGRDRLGKDHGLTGRDFARALGLKERTLRYWARRQKQREERKRDSTANPAGDPPPSSLRTASSQPGRAGRLGRFGLDVTLPGLQAMADTTAWNLFDVPLSIVAVQDPGARRERPWESFEVDDHEDHEVVLKAVREAIGEKGGLQLVTDQGTPYVCEAIRQTCEEMEIELAPQKEGTPTEKGYASYCTPFVTSGPASARAGLERCFLCFHFDGVWGPGGS